MYILVRHFAHNTNEECDTSKFKQTTVCMVYFICLYSYVLLFKVNSLCLVWALSNQFSLFAQNVEEKWNNDQNEHLQ